MLDPFTDLQALHHAFCETLELASRAGLEEAAGYIDADDELELSVLCADERIVEHARRVLEVVHARAEALHAGEIPYASDSLFSPAETGVAERALGIGLLAEAPWAIRAVDTLRLVSVAPTEAKSCPSQGMAYALARPLCAFPTPDVVHGVTQARLEIRHGGVRKKLDRYLATARRNLSLRPEVALRVAGGEKLTKRETTRWLAALEGCWLRGVTWRAEEWVEVVHSHPGTSQLAASLVWQDDDGRSFIGPPDALTDALGEPFPLAPHARVRLWHPLTATPAERSVWRERVIRDRVAQPVRQVIREFYRPADLHVRDLMVDGKQILGLARKEGWTNGYERLDRRVGGVMVSLLLSRNLFPGFEGTVKVMKLEVGAAQRVREPGRSWVVDESRIHGLDPVALSELLREVDLLTSVSAVSLGDAHTWWGDSWETPGGVLRTRRLVLELLLADLQTDQEIVVGDRRVHVGESAVHIATGQVTLRGEQQTIVPVEDHGLWVPPDPLLSRIVSNVVALVQNA